MKEIYVVYWSQSGNTQAMAEAVGRGIAEGGKEAKVVYVGEVSSADLKDAKAFALGRRPVDAGLGGPHDVRRSLRCGRRGCDLPGGAGRYGSGGV